MPGHVEGLFTPFWVAWQGPISEPEPVRLSRHIDDPAGSDDEQQPQPDRGDDLAPGGDEGLGGRDGRSGTSVSLPSPHSFLAADLRTLAELGRHAVVMVALGEDRPRGGPDLFVGKAEVGEAAAEVIQVLLARPGGQDRHRRRRYPTASSHCATDKSPGSPQLAFGQTLCAPRPAWSHEPEPSDCIMLVGVTAQP